jgi:voltage-gated potassium channel
MASRTGFEGSAGVSLEAAQLGKPPSGWRRTAFTVIFESDTRAGRAFDVALLLVILASVLVVMLDSVHAVGGRYELLFDVLEWSFTLLFSAEYATRLACVRRPLRYAGSFYGVVDLVSFLPTYLAFFFPALHVFIDIRMLRMLRVFRILKLTAYMREFRALGEALHASRRRIFIFIGTVAIIVVLLATLMYVVEGPANGFTSIPMAVYWAIATITTVGFGDIVPRTDIGRAIASLMMLLGWGILAVPTGIVTAELTTRRMGRADRERRCASCGTSGHVESARYCQDCGAELP